MRTLTQLLLTVGLALTGNSGSIWIGAVGLPGGTVIGDGQFYDLAVIDPGRVDLGSFTIIPEPTTASLLGLGLIGLTAAGRRRRS